MIELLRNDRRFKEKWHPETCILCFVNLKEARYVGGDLGKAIKTLYVSADFGVVDFSIKGKSTSLHVALPFMHLNFCSFLLFASSHLSFQSLEITKNSI